MTDALVTAEGITKSYKRGSETVQALRSIDFSLFAGEVVALIGPSGSGKSTLLNLLARWEEPDSGSMRWRSNPGAPPVDWEDVAVVPQKLGLINELSVEENITLPSRLSGVLVGEAVSNALMEQLGLERFADRLPLEISVGEQQRTALARALIAHPALLLLDEPTGHQDGEWVDAIFTLLREAAGEGACCLVATHNPEVLSHADRILEIRDGTLHETDTPSTLVAELEAEMGIPSSGDGASEAAPLQSAVDPGPEDSVWRRPGGSR
jgi:putative ABC transport system ATP-binding protein